MYNNVYKERGEIIMLNIPIVPCAPELLVSENSVGEYDDYNYSKIFKGFVHAIIIPLLLAVIFSPKIASIYFISMSVLYATVFRKNWQSFFGSALFVLLIILVLVMPA